MSRRLPWPCAQTHLQLYAQLLEQGWPEPDLARLHAAHGLAMRLHAARFRPSGRPFLAHLVGTASLLAGIEASPDVVVAGLLHAVYDQGDFGDGRRGASPARRARVRRVAGEAAEARIAAYSAMGWGPGVLAALPARFDALSEVERDALRIRLANEIEDHVDLDVLYGGDRPGRLAALEAAVPGLRALALRLGHPELADALDRAACACRTACVPESLCSDHVHCFDVLPPSAWRRPLAAWRNARPRRTAQWARLRALARRAIRRGIGAS